MKAALDARWDAAEGKASTRLGEFIADHGPELCVEVFEKMKTTQEGLFMLSLLRVVTPTPPATIEKINLGGRK